MSELKQVRSCQKKPDSALRAGWSGALWSQVRPDQSGRTARTYRRTSTVRRPCLKRACSTTSPSTFMSNIDRASSTNQSPIQTISRDRRSWWCRGRGVLTPRVAAFDASVTSLADVQSRGSVAEGSVGEPADDSIADAP